MRTREQLLIAFTDELTGLLMESFRQAADSFPNTLSDEHHAKIGRATVLQMRRARALLERLIDEVLPNTEVKPPVANGATAQPARKP